MHFNMTAVLLSLALLFFPSTFSFLQPPTWIGTASNTNNTYLQSTLLSLQAYFYFYTNAH